ncbi:hypothetical protein ABIB54_002936 [Frigoribacterium sp. UYMn621]
MTVVAALGIRPSPTVLIGCRSDIQGLRVVWLSLAMLGYVGGGTWSIGAPPRTPMSLC